MKRKRATRRPTKKTVAMPARPLLELWDRTPDGACGLIPGPTVEKIDDVPLPADFDAVIGFHAGECLLSHVYEMEHEPWFYWWLRLGYDGEHYDNGTVDDRYPRYFFYSNGGLWPAPPKRLDPEGNDLAEPEGWRGKNLALSEQQLFAVGVAMRDAMREGFYLALLRYADELKHVPEAAAMLEATRKNAKKGGAARRKQAEPRRQEARRLDRELRKTVKKKYLRVQRIAAEMKVDTRTVERYLAPKK
jgi:hypothetical protein